MTVALTEEAVYLRLHGVVCRLEAGHFPLRAYVRQYLEYLIVDPGPDPVPQVTVRLHWNGSPPAHLWGSSKVRQWGRRLWQAEEWILQTEVLPLPGLQLAVGWLGDHLEVEAYYQPRRSWREKLALHMGPGQPGAGMSRLYSSLVYYLVIFPLIHYLEQYRGWHLLHAAGVAFPKGAWLLSGLPGSGKSTFALSLLDDPQARLLADNLLLFDAERVYALPEALHLAPTSLELLPENVRAALVDTGRSFSYGRREHHLVSEGQASQARPQALFFLALTGIGSGACRTLALDQAVARLLAFDHLAREVEAYAQFSAALQLTAPRPAHAGLRQETLRALLEHAGLFELALEKGTNLAVSAHQARSALLAQDPPRHSPLPPHHLTGASQPISQATGD